MTRDTVLKRIYHKLITEGECVLICPPGWGGMKYIRIYWSRTFSDEELAEGIEGESPTDGFYVIKAKMQQWQDYTMRCMAKELGELTPWLRRYFAEFGTAGTDEDHQVWKQALGL